MTRPTSGAMTSMKKLLCYLKETRKYKTHSKFTTAGGRIQVHTEKPWVLEPFTESDWGGNKPSAFNIVGNSRGEWLNGVWKLQRTKGGKLEFRRVRPTCFGFKCKRWSFHCYVPIVLDWGCLLGGQQCHETDLEQVWNRALEACQCQTSMVTGQGLTKYPRWYRMTGLYPPILAAKMGRYRAKWLI